MLLVLALGAHIIVVHLCGKVERGSAVSTLHFFGLLTVTHIFTTGCELLKSVALQLTEGLMFPQSGPPGHIQTPYKAYPATTVQLLGLGSFGAVSERDGHAPAHSRDTRLTGRANF